LGSELFNDHPLEARKVLSLIHEQLFYSAVPVRPSKFDEHVRKVVQPLRSLEFNEATRDLINHRPRKIVVVKFILLNERNTPHACKVFHKEATVPCLIAKGPALFCGKDPSHINPDPVTELLESGTFEHFR